MRSRPFSMAVFGAIALLGSASHVIAPEVIPATPDPKWQRSRNRTWVRKPVKRIRTKRKAAQKAQRLARRKNR